MMNTATHPARIRVLLADDHAILRRGLASLLEDEADIMVAGEAADGLQAVAMAQELQPDVILMDVTMPGVDGLEATRRIVARFPQIRIIGLSMHLEADMASTMRAAGAVAYLSKDVSAETLLEAIRGDSVAVAPHR